MLLTIEELMMVIRAFRAINDLETCEKYAEGHARVLSAINIKVKSSERDWFCNPGVYGIIVESEDGTQVYGGAKIQIKTDDFPLPLEDAIGKLDPRIFDLVKQYQEKGTAEICGLWNSREIAGLGVGSSLLVRACVARVGVAISEKLNIDTLFALCASYTLPTAVKAGFLIETSVGENGEFPYPKDRYKAIVAIHKDLNNLTSADELERNAIVSLRQNPIQEKMEKGPKGEVYVKYDLTHI